MEHENIDIFLRKNQMNQSIFFSNHKKSPFLSLYIVFTNDLFQKMCKKELEIQHKIMTFGADMGK